MIAEIRRFDKGFFFNVSVIREVQMNSAVAKYMYMYVLVPVPRPRRQAPLFALFFFFCLLPLIRLGPAYLSASRLPDIVGFRAGNLAGLHSINLRSWNRSRGGGARDETSIRIFGSYVQGIVQYSYNHWLKQPQRQLQGFKEKKKFMGK